MTNTQDLSKFGNRERDIASKLLHALAENMFASDDDELGDGVSVEFNPESGNVFLVDNDYNVLMLNEHDLLENFVSCADCGAEGFRSEMKLTAEHLCATCHKTEMTYHEK